MSDAPASVPEAASEPAQTAWLKDTLNLDPAGYAEPGTADGGAPGGEAPGGIGEFLESIKDAVVFDVESAVIGIEDLIGKHPAPAVIGASQQKQADAKLEKMSDTDKAAYKKIVDKAGPKEKPYLAKGLASGHSLSEISAFAAKIAGKGDQWMQDNLSLTDDSHGKGIKQQWQMSCNATAAQAVQGMFDPIYALKMHEDSPNLESVDEDDPATKNPKLAAQQKAMLEKVEPDGSAGEAHPISNTDPTLAVGRWNTDLLNDVKDVTGVEYASEKVATDEERATKMTEMDKQLADGNPVPIVIGDGAEDEFAHYVLVTSTNIGPPRTYTIHDPASGNSYLRNEQQLKTGHIDVAGWNKLSAFEMPKPIPVK